MIFSLLNQNGTVQTAFLNFSVFVHKFNNHIMYYNLLELPLDQSSKTFIVQWIRLGIDPQTPKTSRSDSLFTFFYQICIFFCHVNTGFSWKGMLNKAKYWILTTLSNFMKFHVRTKIQENSLSNYLVVKLTSWVEKTCIFFSFEYSVYVNSVVLCDHVVLKLQGAI